MINAKVQSKLVTFNFVCLTSIINLVRLINLDCGIVFYIQFLS